jgi:hypothetical protein
MGFFCEYTQTERREFSALFFVVKFPVPGHLGQLTC